MSNLPKKLQEIKERCEKATPDESWDNCPGHCHHAIGIWDKDNGAKAGTTCDECLRWNNYYSIRADIPRLVKALEACMEQRRRMTYNELTEDERKMFFTNKVLDSMDQELKAILEGECDDTK